jgi:hypothetical protein
VDILSNLAELSDERLAEYGAEVRAEFDALITAESPTSEQIDQAERYADAIDAVETERASREQTAASLAERAEALRTRFTETPAEGTDEGGETASDEHPEENDSGEEDSGEESTQAAARPRVRELATRVPRPRAPAATRAPITITAAADVPEFSTGSALENLETVSTALLNRMRGFGTPSGDGENENLQHYGVAQFRMDFPPELTIDRHSDDMEVLAHASREHRLPGQSLVAAGGWCAPSETLYDLCTGETAEGILSVPEVNVARGGIKYTSGPDFSTIYANTGFSQTEAQAISGTAKTCFEVPCPAFVEVRLDVVGICIKAPILTNAAYPELVQRWLSGSLIAHQHRVNAKVIAALATAAGAAKVITGIGTTAGDTLGGLELIADGLRQKYRLSMTATLEVVVPFWAQSAIRADLSNRMGVATEVITDQVIAAHFSARNLAVSFVYDWQDLAAPPAVAYPATFQALMYPAGTFIKGTSDVINLNAVYDAASLATNLYTALFFEEGVLVAKMCNEAALVTLPVCNAGRTGTANLVCA